MYGFYSALFVVFKPPTLKSRFLLLFHLLFRTHQLTSWHNFFDLTSLTLFQSVALLLFQYFISVMILVTFMQSVNISTLCCVPLWISLWYSVGVLEDLPCLSAQSPLTSGPALSCSSLTMHETFSHIHIQLIYNTQHNSFFVCSKIDP